jgi:hypothetical protein
VPTSVSSLSLVRYRLNDYSVPTTYGHREVLVRGYVHDVVILCGATVIARHPRSYEREDFIFRAAARGLPAAQNPDLHVAAPIAAPVTELRLLSWKTGEQGRALLTDPHGKPKNRCGHDGQRKSVAHTPTAAQQQQTADQNRDRKSDRLRDKITHTTTR